MAADTAVDSPRRHALADSTSLTPTPPSSPAVVEPLLGWAERVYAELFPAGPATQLFSYGGQTYSLRYYAPTGNYVGVALDGGVWGYGPFTNNTLRGFGHVNDYRCLVSPASCVPVVPSCETEVATGFGGDLNAVYESAGGGDSGDGGGGGDSGSAGVGGSEGKVLGARVSIFRLRDGALLAQGLTDNRLGLVTVQWCKADLPVLVEMQGAPGARYFDEAVNDLVEFPLTQKLRALVDRFDENVGVSAKTEAAFLYALNQLQSDPAAVAGGIRPLATDGVPVGLTSEQVRQANAAVLAEVNRRLTDRLQQESMKALATPIDQTSSSNALPRNRYGRTAALTGGFAKLARAYNLDTATPALAFTRQFALDFTDGRIDDYALNGQSAVTAARSLGPAQADKATYRGTEAGLNWALGQGLLGQQFGQTTTRLDGDPYVAAAPVWTAFSAACSNGWGETRIANHYLSTIGTLTLLEYTAPPGGCIWDPGTTSTTRLNVLTGIRKLVNQVTERAFAIGLDGTVWGWGRNGCGRVGNGVIGNTVTVQPTRIEGLSRVIDVATVGGINVALTSDGEVYTWGANGQELAGLGSNLTDPLCTEDRWFNLSFPGAAPVRVIATPRKVPGLANIVAISAGGATVNAVRSDGRVYQWGNVANAQGRTVQSSSPVEVLDVVQPRKVVNATTMSFAIVAGGRVATWWDTAYEIFDRPAAGLPQPQVLPGLDDIVDIVADPLGTTLALRGDGSLWFWGRWVAGNDGYITLKPRRVNLPVRKGGVLVPAGQPALPRIVRLTVVANFVAAIGADNLTYRLIPGRTADGFFWEGDSAYLGAPPPF